MALPIGTRVGHYEVTSILGVGGMGEVYRAHDPRLGRDVALKVLPDSVASDPERLARLTREARLLASLNHPNIAAIHGFEEAAGISALVLELVEGPTLGDRLARGPLPIADAIAIARQVAAAIDGAHTAGIVHRDLKPENIKVRPDGTVKVLDFGLGRALTAHEGAHGAAQAPTVTGVVTRAGAILGTPAYMSPEQARGEVAGRSTDIWAFGCVLFEMLSGRRTFPGSTTADTISAVLTREPEWAALPPETPPNVRRLTGRCLVRDPRRRLRDIGDALLELESTEPAGDAAGTRRAGAGRRQVIVPWALAGLATAVAVLVQMGAWRTPESPPFAGAVLEQVTHDAGATITPAVSPDGSLLAYASNRSGRPDLDIWVQRASGGPPLRLTDDPADDQMPGFSPDGTQIAFRSERDGGGIYVVPALGGDARLIVRGGRSPRFSPDGRRLTYWDGAWRGGASATTNATAVYVVALDGSAPVRLAADFALARDGVWSPDGTAILILGRQSAAEPVADALDWWLLPIDGGRPIRTGAFAQSPGDRDGFSPSAWTSQGVFFSARRDIWALPLSTGGKVSGPLRRLTAATRTATDPVVAQDGTILFGTSDSRRVIERVSLDGGDAAPVRVYEDDQQETDRPSVTADASTLVLELAYATYREIWRRSLSTGRQQMIARVDTPALLSATVSPDGSRVAYTVPPTQRGYVVNTSQGVPRVVCERCTVFGFLADNVHVLASVDNATAIAAIDTRDGRRRDLVRVAEGTVTRPHPSPDDRWLAFRHAIAGEAVSYVTPIRPGGPSDPGAWQRIEDPTHIGRPAGWALDSSVVYLLLDTDGFRCVWGQRVDRTGRLLGTPVAVRHFHDVGRDVSTTFGNAVAADGFYFARSETRGNIWRLRH